MQGSYVNATGVAGAGTVCGAAAAPCMEGWDAITFGMLDPSRALLRDDSATLAATATTARATNDGSVLFAIENLSSRRGRDALDAAYRPRALGTRLAVVTPTSTPFTRRRRRRSLPPSRPHRYWPLPNKRADFPYQAGGNPAQAALAAEYAHVRALEARWAELLNGTSSSADASGDASSRVPVPNWILVDFFNTTTPEPDVPSRTLLPNPSEGLIAAVRDVNLERRGCGAAAPAMMVN